MSALGVSTVVVTAAKPEVVPGLDVLALISTVLAVLVVSVVGIRSVHYVVAICEPDQFLLLLLLLLLGWEAVVRGARLMIALNTLCLTGCRLVRNGTGGVVRRATGRTVGGVT